MGGYMKARVDRIVEQSLAVLLVGEKEEEHIIPLSRIPAKIKEGDMLEVELQAGSIVKLSLLTSEEEEQNRARIAEKMQLLKQQQQSRFKKN